MATAEQRQALGRYGEDLAARYLSGLGMVVLDRNWRCDLGELDLVLRDGNTAVFCEVKARTSERFGSPLEAIDPVKITRIRHLAARWLLDHAVHPVDIRLDLVGVRLDAPAADRLIHVPGVG